MRKRKTIADMVKLADVTVRYADTWLAWEDGWGDCDGAWTVTQWPNATPAKLILRTRDEAEAVAAFVKAAGLEDE